MEKTGCCLRIEALSKTYAQKKKRWGNKGMPREQAVKALAHVAFDLTPGLYGLLGPNGAGKSTLMNIITGNLRPDAGRVLWNNEDTTAMGIRYRRILGYMPQHQALYSNFTGRRFLLYIAALKEVEKPLMNDIVKEMAEKFNLNEELDRLLGSYSGGMRQRLLAASAFLGQPSLLVMDEPSAGLDPKERVRLRCLLAEYAQRHIVLLATHVVSDIESIAKQVIILKQGVVIDKAAPQDLVRRFAKGKSLEDVYLSIFNEDAV